MLAFFVMKAKILLLQIVCATLLAAAPARAADEKEPTTDDELTAFAAEQISIADYDQQVQEDLKRYMPTAAGGVSAADPFPLDEDDDTGVKTKYVYKGEAIGVMRRSFKDDRIDDGYVQGLLQQRGPE